MNKFQTKLFETIIKVGNESCSNSDEDVGDGSHGIGEEKLRLTCHKKKIYWGNISKFTHTV